MTGNCVEKYNEMTVAELETLHDEEGKAFIVHSGQVVDCVQE